MDKRQLIGQIRQCLKLNEFRTIAIGAGSVSLVKNSEEIIISYTKYPGKFLLPPALSGYKSFSQVDQILEKYFLEHGLKYSKTTIFRQSRREENLELRTIENPEDLIKVVPELEKMVYEDIIPFFETYNSLDEVAKRIGDLKEEELSKFIYTPIHPRIMIIKRLVNDPDWESYAKGALEIYKKQSTGKYKEVFEPIYKFLPDLFEELRLLQI